ncbi:flagellar biosynthetic protein FliP [Desulfurobacterium pacificum]|jgi:flagellar biosynthetic protein FliP|uniref:Flagellar biosynthetic protein FliP n=1 Tax=Desulfurobacterium pacificum TaxID=240166 RepID=A0ABY1NMV3_9BACT|nr:flagellar type III secretion system pore protein FliP [Desulfurobacterium pacificum]SMP13815.1 flagellar biosynthetic protein FliP [Desulfurobacterium pacificum]
MAIATVNDIVSQFGQVDITLKILFLITILSLAPAILITVTSFTRIVIILSLLRHALGTPQTPPNQVIIALSLFLTVFTMAPTFEKINQVALQPYLKGQISDVEAVKRSVEPLKEFMLRNTRKEDLKLFLDIRGEKPKTPEDVSLVTLIPAFMVSEIKTALEVVFVIFLPFIVIDLLVASILMSMGMMMIPPMMLSLPFKLILFVVSGGWELLIKSIILSYR